MNNWAIAALLVVWVGLDVYVLRTQREGSPTKPGSRIVAVSPQYNVEATFKAGYSAGLSQKINETIIHEIANQNYRTAWREGYQEGRDLGCQAEKDFQGKTFDEVHPSPEGAN